MQGMSAPEWARYMREEVGVALTEPQINQYVVDALLEGYRADLPLLPGAVAAVERLAAGWPLGLASSANRVIIDEVLELAGLRRLFTAVVSSEEVARGKPSPDVYVEAARRLGVDPPTCVAVEDSTNGIRSALAAGMRVVAIPNRQFPPAPDVLAQAALVLPTVEALTPDRVGRL
jgi:HAD superfamily hydrolase (TIGR01509 family)